MSDAETSFDCLCQLRLNLLRQGLVVLHLEEQHDALVRVINALTHSDRLVKELRERFDNTIYSVRFSSVMD